MASALKLLEQRCYKEISVLDIVADSGVNRNTFYYHFKDMPALIEELACRSIDGAFADSHAPLLDKLKAAVDTMYKHKKIALHVYSSAERVVFDKCLDKVCEHLVKHIFDCCPEIQLRNPEDKERFFTLCKCCCYGIVCDWLLYGLSDEGRLQIHAICEDAVKVLN